jgi:hypothetical protein
LLLVVPWLDQRADARARRERAAADADAGAAVRASSSLLSVRLSVSGRARRVGCAWPCVGRKRKRERQARAFEEEGPSARGVRRREFRDRFDRRAAC